MRASVNDAHRLEEIEIKLAHLERGLLELSDVVLRQQQEIDALRSASERLAEQLSAGGGDPDSATRVEIPPHY
jgi:SlyX protein